jgi:hypothetical protein
MIFSRLQWILIWSNLGVAILCKYFRGLVFFGRASPRFLFGICVRLVVCLVIVSFLCLLRLVQLETLLMI